MKISKRFLLIALLLLTGGTMKAQCPSTLFIMPDTVCAGTNFQITNSSTTGANYVWDLNNGDLSKTPTGQNIGNFSTYIPYQIRPVIANGNKHVFVCNYGNNNLLRLDFGSSYDNTPVAFVYGNIGGLLNAPIGIDIINENGIWYAIIVNETSQNLVRVNLGSNISANTASATDLGLFGLTTPKSLKIARDSSKYHVFVTNAAGNNLTRVDFGNSITNTPTGSTVFSDPGFINGWGVDIGFDCIIGKFMGFVVCNTQNSVRILDFGNSLSNPPVITSSLTTIGGPTGIQLVKDGADWHLLVASSSQSRFQNFKISQNLANTPAVIFGDTLGGALQPRSIGIIKDSTKFYGFLMNASQTITKIKWPDNLLNTPAVSNDPVAVTAVSNASGYQTVLLTSTDASGFITYHADSIYISPSPTGAFSTSPGCEEALIQFNDSTTIATGTVAGWTWDFGDGSPLSNLQSPTHTFSGTGSFNITLTTASSAGCTNTITQPLDIYPNPQAQFTFIDNQCEKTPVLFTDQSTSSSGTTINSWSWDFGDNTSLSTLQNPTHPFDSAATYNVTLIAVTDVGCTDTLTTDITIIPRPQAEFSVSSTCVGESAVFTNQSVINGGSTLSYDWDFGDSNNSILTNPTNQYPSNAANYDVTLIAEASNGCLDTTMQNIRISDQPVPQFSFSPLVVCQGNAVYFSNLSVGSGIDTVLTYSWDFGDAITSDLTDPTHVYADTGYYNVTLTAISPTYCDSSITQQIYVIPGPTAQFSAAGVCLSNTTSFNPLVVTPPGTQVDSIVWTFGDGAGFTGTTSPTHTYTAPGRYGVTMIVYNDLLCTATFTDSVDVFPIPVAQFTQSLSCSNDTIFFDGTLSQVSGDIITSWLWDFNGAGSASDSMPEFIFPNAGVYDVTLITSTSNGCTDTVQNQITVIQSPDFYFTFNEPCFGVNATFNYVSNITPTPPSNLLWNFGDGTLSSTLSPSHFFTAADSFMVTLTVTNPNTGCTAVNDSMIVVKPVPAPGFFSSDECEDLSRTFTDTSSISGGSIVSWNWDFGVIGTSTDQNPTIVPTEAGTYNATLLVTSDEGCTASTVSQFIVYPRPIAAFVSDPIFGSPPLTVNFLNNTVGGDAYLWDFGDGSSGFGNSPSHIYADTGVYNITMIASSVEGCLDTSYFSISVLIPYLDLAVLNIFATIDDGQVSLRAQIANQGNITINDAVITGSIQDAPPISENYLGSLLPGQVILYEFVSTYQMASDYLPSFFCIEAKKPNGMTDQNESNDKICNALSGEFELYTIYPSPFSDEITINFNLNLPGLFIISINDVIGRNVYNSIPTTGLEGFNSIKINTEGLNKGIYNISVKYGDQIKANKAIKIK